MPAQRRKQPAKKPVDPEPQQDEQQPTPEEVAHIIDAQPPAGSAPVKESAPHVPDHVRQLARTVRRHLGNPRVHFDAANGVPVMFGYKSLYHVGTNGHPQTHIATRDELSEMSDQQIYDRVMHGRTPPRQGYPIGGQ